MNDVSVGLKVGAMEVREEPPCGDSTSFILLYHSPDKVQVFGNPTGPEVVLEKVGLSEALVAGCGCRREAASSGAW